MSLNACKDIRLAVNTKYTEVGRHRGMIANEHFRIGNNSYEKVKIFKYLGFILANKNYIQEKENVDLKQGIHVSSNTFVFSTSLQEFEN